MEKFNKKQVANAFSRAAVTYDGSAILQRRVARKLIEILKTQQLPKKILDLGCGTGYLTDQLIKHFPKASVTAVDFAFGMLRYCKMKGMTDSTHWVCADADHLPFPNNYFEWVVSNLMLQWSPNPSVTWQELLRVLKPGGFMMVSTLGPGTLMELRRAWQMIDNHPHVHDFSCPTTFYQGPICIKKYFRHFTEAIQLMKELKALGASNIVANRSKGLLTKEILNQVCKAYEMFRKPNGLLQATYEVHFLEGKKNP